MTMEAWQTNRKLETANIAVVPLGVIQLRHNEDITFQGIQLAGVLGQIVNIQSIYVDASTLARHVTVRNDKTRLQVKFAAGCVGWQPLLIGTDATQLTFRSEATGEIFAQAASYPFLSPQTPMGIIQSRSHTRRIDIPASLSSQIFLDQNFYRAGFSIWNDSPNTLYLNVNASPASTTNFSVIIGPSNYFESPYPYGGEVRGVWNGVSGGARITEYE